MSWTKLRYRIKYKSTQNKSSCPPDALESVWEAHTILLTTSSECCLLTLTVTCVCVWESKREKFYLVQHLLGVSSREAEPHASPGDPGGREAYTHASYPSLGQLTNKHAVKQNQYIKDLSLPIRVLLFFACTDLFSKFVVLGLPTALWSKRERDYR